MAEIVIQESQNQWQGDSPVTGLLIKLENNPFVSFSEMSFNSSLEQQSYQRSKALEHLKKGKQNSVKLSTEEPFRFRGWITKGSIHNTVGLGMANPNLQKLNLTELVNYTGQVAQLLPQFVRAEIYADYKVKEFYESQKLAWLPECFRNFVLWYHLISPRAYEPYYTHDEMLSIPAHCVRELDNGWIEIISYADPLAYDQPETRERIVAMTNYLNALRHDWQPTPLASAV